MRWSKLLAAAAAATLAGIAAAAPAAAEPAMWRVHDADTEITLFGTIHALPPAVQWYTPRIAARFAAANYLVLETIIPDDPAGLTPLIRSLGVRAGLPALGARVAPSRQAALAAGIALLGLPAARLDGMETWLAAIAIGDGAVSRLGLTPAAGVEATLTVKAKAAAKPILGLETPAQQLGLFDTLPEADQRALLEATVDDLTTARDDTNAMIAYWQAGETDQLAADFDKQLRATPNLQAALLTRRNAHWADWIVKALDHPGTMFIAVGAGHLGGADSVVAMLAARGVAVERLP